MFTFLMGSEAQALTLQQWFGLVLAGIAMWVYNLKDERNEDGEMVKGVNLADAGDMHVARSVSLSRASFSSEVRRSSGLRLSSGGAAGVARTSAV